MQSKIAQQLQLLKRLSLESNQKVKEPTLLARKSREKYKLEAAVTNLRISGIPHFQTRSKRDCFLLLLLLLLLLLY